jgi:hypothetical protein
MQWDVPYKFPHKNHSLWSYPSNHSKEGVMRKSISWSVNTLLAVMLILAFTASQAIFADSTVIYVNRAASGANDGTSWDDAYIMLQDALAVAQPGDGIWVATGIYTPGTTVHSTFNIPPGAALYGGFDPQSGAAGWGERNWVAHPTVLSGDIDGNDTTDVNGVVTTTAGISGTNTYHVVYLDGTSTPITGRLSSTASPSPPGMPMVTKRTTLAAARSVMETAAAANVTLH